MRKWRASTNCTTANGRLLYGKERVFLLLELLFCLLNQTFGSGFVADDAAEFARGRQRLRISDALSPAKLISRTGATLSNCGFKCANHGDWINISGLNLIQPLQIRLETQTRIQRGFRQQADN